MKSTGATIDCPKCGAAIPLTEAIAGPALAEMRKGLESEVNERLAAIKKREDEVETRVEQAKRDAMTYARAQATNEMRSKVVDAEAETLRIKRLLDERDEKLAEAQEAQAKTLKLQRELTDAKRELELTIENRVSEETHKIQTAARLAAEQANSLVLAERDRTIANMREELEAAITRANQRDQKAQGEVLELDFEERLRLTFPEDGFVAVSDKSGRGDIHQMVRYHGKDSGVIVWELKRTKNWSGDWAPKLRGIQRGLNASAAILCSQALPDDLVAFGEYDRVWVCSPDYALPLCTILRQWVIEVDLAGRRQEGQASKAELVYQYMTGSQFRQRIEAVVEHFSTMREDLAKERQTISKSWAKRESQINLILNSVSGLYGDLQGIAGATVKELPALTLPE